MKLSFDYYRNLEKIDFYLCNPDGRELYPLLAKNRRVALRYNDLSELTFVADDKYTDRDGKDHIHDYYDYIRTKRLVYATGIGWFRIKNVDEQDDGINKYKTVTAESLQATLNDKGFVSEERPYVFFNPADPYDSFYDSSVTGAVPSVLGQWNRQLGIKIDLSQGRDEPSVPYEDWTVTYISSSLIGLHRTFQENITFGYDWIANEVENAFEAVVHFDILNKAIHILTVAEVAANKAGVIYTFRNFMKNVNVTENADDVVTVLNCYGNNCDITMVNPTGTNYICDFSYYMDEVEHRWMSDALIAKLKQWQSACEESRPAYVSLVGQYRAACETRLQLDTDLQYASTYLTELKNASNNRSVLGTGKSQGTLCGVVRAEGVNIGEYSLDIDAEFESVAFNGSSIITAYANKPTYSPVFDEAGKIVPRAGRWSFEGKSITASADDIITANLSQDEGTKYWYFTDTNGANYCKLKGSSEVNKETLEVTHRCEGFDRYIAMLYPIVEEKTEIVNEGTEQEKKVTKKTTKYIDSVQSWIDIHESRVFGLNSNISATDTRMDGLLSTIKSISNRLNIISYFSDTPSLLRELECYWCEGEFENNNIAILNNTTYAEEIDLANELMAAGYNELSRVSQPRFSFSLDAIDATKNYEFRSQMQELELGRVITIEKAEGLWYYPVLLELSMSLDDTDDFAMTFANALRLDDWGYTYADLIKSAVSTSRQVGANWQNIVKYVKERDEIQSVIKAPLDLTLRAATANMTNQEFSIDSTGILGRKKVGEASSEFEAEQVRLINNVLIFTDDNWKTLKTALGKITIPDPTDSAKTITKYGLAGEVIVGELLIGNALQLHNEDSSIIIDENGIFVRRSPETEDPAKDIIFSVDKMGNLTLQGYATVKEMEDGFQETKATIKTLSDGNQATFEALTSFQRETNETIKGIDDEILSVKTSITEADARITAVTNAQESTAGLFTSFKTETQTAITSLNGDITGINGDIAGINGDIADINGEITVVKTSIAEADARITAVTNAQESTAGLFTNFKTDTETAIKNIDDEITNVKNAATSADARITAVTNAQGSTAEQFTSFKTETSEAIKGINNEITGVKSSVTEANAKITTITDKQNSLITLTANYKQYQGKVDDLETGLRETKSSVSDISLKANANESKISLLTSWVGTDANGNLVSSASEIKNRVTSTEASIEGIANWAGTDKNGSPVEGKSGISQKVNSVESQLETLTSWSDGAKTSIAAVEQKASENEASITQTATLAGDAMNYASYLGTQVNQHEAAIQSYALYAGRIAGVEAKASANEQSVTTLAGRADGFDAKVQTLENALGAQDSQISAIETKVNNSSAQIQEVAQWKTENATSIANTISYVDDNKSTIDSIATWKESTSASVAEIQQQVSQNSAAISQKASMSDLNGYAKTAELETKVSKSDNGQVVSMINASADVITLNSNRLIINSTGFTLDANGYITATGGNFSGTINGSVFRFGNTGYYIDGTVQDTLGCYVNLPGFSITGEQVSFTQQIYATSISLSIGAYFGRAYIQNTGTGAALQGTWTDSAGVAVTSARQFKTNIANLDERHSVLFDNLTPRSFQYIEGQSGRTHYGLIVDELREAMDAAGLTTEECAAYCLGDPSNPDGEGGIRYYELVALCIREIQRLKQELSAIKGA